MLCGRVPAPIIAYLWLAGDRCWRSIRHFSFEWLLLSRRWFCNCVDVYISRNNWVIKNEKEIGRQMCLETRAELEKAKLDIIKVHWIYIWNSQKIKLRDKENYMHFSITISPICTYKFYTDIYSNNTLNIQLCITVHYQFKNFIHPFHVKICIFLPFFFLVLASFCFPSSWQSSPFLLTSPHLLERLYFVKSLFSISTTLVPSLKPIPNIFSSCSSWSILTYLRF